MTISVYRSSTLAVRSHNDDQSWRGALYVDFPLVWAQGSGRIATSVPRGRYWGFSEHFSTIGLFRVQRAENLFSAVVIRSAFVPCEKGKLSPEEKSFVRIRNRVFSFSIVYGELHDLTDAGFNYIFYIVGSVFRKEVRTSSVARSRLRTYVNRAHVSATCPE